jgi:hypothetical protein
LLRPHLKPLVLKQEAVLLKAGDPVGQVYFPHSGIISLVTIEVAMIGRDGMLGAELERMAVVVGAAVPARSSTAAPVVGVERALLSSSSGSHTTSKLVSSNAPRS